MSESTGKGRGFKSMTPEQRKELGKKGGATSQKNGTAYRFDSASAKAAASKLRGPRNRLGKFEIPGTGVAEWRKALSEVAFDKFANTVAAMAAEILPNVQGAYLLVFHEGADGKGSTTSKMLTVQKGDGWSVVEGLISGMEHDIAECDERAKKEGFVRIANNVEEPSMPASTASTGGYLKLVPSKPVKSEKAKKEPRS